MGIESAFLLFGIFIIVYILIAEVFTVLFRLTGLTEEKAKFQVISMLTNSGYTTQESEIIATSTIRRKLARITMIFGYSFTVTIVSSVVNVFLALGQIEMHRLIPTLVVWGLFLLVLYIFLNNKLAKSKFDGFIEKLGSRIMFGKNANPIIILDSYGGIVMAEVFLTNLPSIFVETAMMHTGLKEQYNVMILLIKRNGVVIDTIKGDTVILKGDTLVVFGGRKGIREVFESPME